MLDIILATKSHKNKTPINYNCAAKEIIRRIEDSVPKRVSPNFASLTEQRRINSYKHGMKQKVTNNPILRPTTVSSLNPINKLNLQNQRYLSTKKGRTTPFLSKENTIAQTIGFSEIMNRRKSVRKKVIINADTILTKLNGYFPHQTVVPNIFITPIKTEGMNMVKTIFKKERVKKREEDLANLDVSKIELVNKQIDDSVVAITQLLDSCKKSSIK